MKPQLLIRELDLMIRHGQGKRVQERFARLRGSRSLGAYRANMAQLAWRVDMPELGLRILQGAIRTGTGFTYGGSTAERAEYAQCLIRMGAADEGLQILSTLSAAEYGRVPLYTASARISQWDYAEALAPIRTYLKGQRRGTYGYLVGRSNLAAVLVFLGQHYEAEQVLRELLYETSIRRLGLLHGSCLELIAQNFMRTRQWNRIYRCLEGAQASLREAGALDSFMVRKWRVLVAISSKEISRRAGRVALSQVVEEARVRRLWETVRQCDVFRAIEEQNADLIGHLFYGTPYPCLRERILSEFNQKIQLPKTYEWRRGECGPHAPVLDLVSGGAFAARSHHVLKFRPGMHVHRFLLALATDFYRPIRTATVFYHLAPGEPFHGELSAARVHQAVRFARSWLRKARLPLAIVRDSLGYALTASGPCRILVSERDSRKSTSSCYVARLKANFGTMNFSTVEASRECGQSRRSTVRWLNECIEQGSVERVGKGPRTFYRLR